MLPMNIALTSLIALALSLSGGEEPFRDLSLDEALAAAAKEKKVVMIDFFTTWCPPCKKLDATTWKDDEVVAWLDEHTVAIKLDAEKEAEIAKRFHVNAYPTMTFVKPDGTRMDQIVGYRDASAFLNEAADALAGRTAVDRARDALLGDANNPMKRDDLGSELARAGRYDEALAEFLWCWDQGLEHRSSYSGVRVSFLLGKIESLARDYPPAKEAMRERIDALAQLVRQGEASSDELDDLGSLQKHFGPPELLLELFDELARDETRAEACRELAEKIAPQLVKAGRYRDLLAHGPDVAELLRSRREMVDRLESHLGEDTPGNEYVADAIEHTRSRAIVEFGVYFEAIVAVGDGSELDQPSADAVEQQILALSSSGWTYYKLIQHATRAGDASRARALVERARHAVTDERDLKRIERAAKKIPKAEPAGAPAGG